VEQQLSFRLTNKNSWSNYFYGANQGQTFQVANNVVLSNISINLMYCDYNTTAVMKIYNGVGGSLIAPLGIALSGLSILSRSASKTSLNTIPPPYKPIVDKQSKNTGKNS
jgi:hypothetical protein